MLEQYVGNPHYEHTANLFKLYDSPAFDPNGETLSLQEFEPMVRMPFTRTLSSIYGGATASATQERMDEMKK